MLGRKPLAFTWSGGEYLLALARMQVALALVLLAVVAGIVLCLSWERFRQSRSNLNVMCSGDLLNLRSTLATLLNERRSDLEIFCTAQSLSDGDFSSLMNELAERADQES